MKRTHKRLVFVLIGGGLLALATALALTALDDSVAFFRSPSELVSDPALGQRRVRVGGLVEEGSVVRGAGGVVTFRVTDLEASVPVHYTGILPDLFREGQGVVAEGRIEGGTFVADSVLAKHDERYMPPEAAAALKAAGKWQHMEKALEEAGQLPGAQSR